MGAWIRVCGPRDALWLTILRRGTFCDFSKTRLSQANKL